MQQGWRAKAFVVGMTFGVVVTAGCAARQPEAAAGLMAAEQQTANAASRAEQAAQRAEAAATRADAAATRVEQAAQRAEAAALKVEERLTKRLRK